MKNFDEKFMLDNIMLNIRSEREELGLSMNGFTTINGVTILKLKTSEKSLINHSYLGFSLNDKCELVLHLIEASTNSDIIEPMNVPNEMTMDIHIYRIMNYALEALWHYEGGFYFKNNDANTQWELVKCIYETILMATDRHLDAEYLCRFGYKHNLNIRDHKGYGARKEFEHLEKYGTPCKTFNEMVKDFKEQLYYNCK